MYIMSKQRRDFFKRNQAQDQRPVEAASDLIKKMESEEFVKVKIDQHISIREHASIQSKSTGSFSPDTEVMAKIFPDVDGLQFAITDKGQYFVFKHGKIAYAHIVDELPASVEYSAPAPVSYTTGFDQASASENVEEVLPEDL